MKKLMAILVCATVAVVLWSSTAQASMDVAATATQGKWTDWRYPDAVQTNTTQLATRKGTDPDCKKSWLQFDLTALYAANPGLQGNVLSAKLTLYGAKTETGGKAYTLSGLNDAAGLEGWVASALTWNNAPGNNTATGNTLDATMTTALYTLTIPVPVMNVMSETPEANRAGLASFLNTDTDGKVTFIFTAGGTTYLWNAGNTAGYAPTLTLTYVPEPATLMLLGLGALVSLKKRRS